MSYPGVLAAQAKLAEQAKAAPSPMPPLGKAQFGKPSITTAQPLKGRKVKKKKRARVKPAVRRPGY